MGSARVITDELGNVTARKDYMAFGEEAFTLNRTSTLKYGGGDDLRKRYTGYEQDDETGLDFAQARYYNPKHGRFTSVDPLTASANVKDPQTFNRYSYALNSPYKFTDPLGLVSEHTTSHGNRGRNSGAAGGGFVSTYGTAFQEIAGTDFPYSQNAPVPPPPPPPKPANYYISRDGKIRTEATKNSFSSYFIELKDQPGKFSENPQFKLEHNSFGLVYFPDSSDFFERYSNPDAGGKNNGVNHGKGDHYLEGDVAAALFGLAAVLKDSHGITISFGDMSADNGTDPWEKGSRDHEGHGHSSRSGLDIDFRYINEEGVSFRGEMTDKQFSVEKNQIVFDTAKTFGFTENFQGNAKKLKNIATADGHNNHGHLGFGR